MSLTARMDPQDLRSRLALPADGSTTDLLDLSDRRTLLRWMLLTREVEEAGGRLYRQGKIPGSFYDGRGQEAIAVGATYALNSDDAICSPLIRDLGSHLVRGTDLTELFRHYMGRENRLSRGREGNVHFGDRQLGIVGMVSMLPDMMVVATGLAMAFSMQGEHRCALSFFGDGSTSRGDWHEAMNWSSLQSLPVIFILEDNQFAYSTPQTRQFAVHPLARAAGYGIEAVGVDGNDVEAVFAATAAARERALAEGDPHSFPLRRCGCMATEHTTTRAMCRVTCWRPGRGEIPSRRTPHAWQARESTSTLCTPRSGPRSAMPSPMLSAAPLPDPRGVLNGVFAEGDPKPLGSAGLAGWSGYHRPAAAA